MWSNLLSIESKRFVCYNCNNTVASSAGFYNQTPAYKESFIYICPHCNIPTFFTKNNCQIPNPIQIESISSTNVKEDVSNLFEEVRNSFSVKAYTAVAILCRKILMNLAVDNGAESNKTFKEYVDYIKDENLVSKNTKPILDKIRGLGNDANHEIKSITQQEAELTVKLTIELINQNYEVNSLANLCEQPIEKKKI